jgi:PPOX class probable F420-dependent enzyme
VRPIQTARRKRGKRAFSSLSQTEIRRLLNHARVARLVTTSRQQQPHAVPVCFVYRQGFLYTPIDLKPKRLTARNLTRVRNIQARPHVALLVDHYEEDWSKLWFLLVRGKAKILSTASKSERENVLRALRRKYPQYAAGMLGKDPPLIRIAPQRFTVWRSSSSTQV